MAFEAESSWYRAPGRVNLIGEHTDYNDGWVMPAAIELSAWVGATPRGDRRIRLRSAQYPEGAEFDLDEAAAGGPPAAPHWSHALRGVAVLLERGGCRLRGADLAIESDIPIGAGLSSSAAVEVAVGLALRGDAGEKWDRTALARLCQQASQEFGGTRCGIMDPYIACHGRAGQVVALDTRNLAARWLAWPQGAALVACDTGVRHDNASSGYNRRREECEAAVRELGRRLPGLRSLREVEAEDLERWAGELDAVLLARCRHVVSENARVGAAAAALTRGDFGELGRLMDASHRSLRDDYQVSCPELDRVAAVCGQQEGVYGARMMGGGFGGCVLALVRPERVEALQARLGREYRTPGGAAPAVWVCHPAAGAERVTAREGHAGR